MMNIALVNESENEFDRIKRDFDFFNSIMEQNRDMEHFVNESLIIASGNKRAINEMTYITEAAAGDKIKAFFEKIKNFFKKIFDKLGASLNAVFQEQKKYIEQYQYIITKCKWQVGDVSDVYDHFKGLPRIVEVADTGETAIFGTNMKKYLQGEKIADGSLDDVMLTSNDTFTNANDIEKKLTELKNKQDPKPEELKGQRFDSFLQESPYWKSVADFKKVNDSNNNVSVNDTFKAWFNGSEDTVNYSGDEIENNFQTIINGVYAGASYLTKLEKIVSTVNKKMDACEKNMEDYYKAQSEKIMKAVKQEVPKQEENKQQSKIELEFEAGSNGKYKIKSGVDNPSEYGENTKDELIKAVKQKVGHDNVEEKSNGGTPEKKKKKSEINITTDSGKADNAAGKYSFATADGISAMTNNDGEDLNTFKARVEKAYTDAGYTLESSDILSNFRSYFNEMKFGNGSSGNSEEKGQPLTGNANQQVNNASKTAGNLSNASNTKMTANGPSTNTDLNGKDVGAVSKSAEELLAIDIRRHQAIVNADTMISTAITTSMFNAFKLTNKDFFDIIKAHVQWYLSNPGAEKNSENIVSRPRQTDMSAGSVKKNTTTTPEQSETQNK